MRAPNTKAVVRLTKVSSMAPGLRFCRACMGFRAFLVNGLKGASLPAVAADVDALDRKGTRLNSSHLVISYAVFCLKKKKESHDWLITSDIHAVTTSAAD